eukprot:2035144-Rhodomonas_salina.13
MSRDDTISTVQCANSGVSSTDVGHHASSRSPPLSQTTWTGPRSACTSGRAFSDQLKVCVSLCDVRYTIGFHACFQLCCWVLREEILALGLGENMAVGDRREKGDETLARAMPGIDVGNAGTADRYRNDGGYARLDEENINLQVKRVGGREGRRKRVVRGEGRRESEGARAEMGGSKGAREQGSK